MSEYRFIATNWENPHPLEVLLDRWLKGTLGIPYFYEPFVRRLKLRGDETVLDFGCGSGIGAARIARRLTAGGRLTGVDISHFWVAKARQRLARFPNAECLVGDIRDLPVPRGAYDIVCMVHVLHDIPPREREPIMQALAARLKPGGRLVCSEPTRPEHGMPATEIEALARAAGLTPDGCEQRGNVFHGVFVNAR